MLDIRPYPEFNAAAEAVLDYLHVQLKFGLWMVTRTEGDDWIVLQALDHGYGVKKGDVFPWADSFCSQMVLGRGPCIAPRSREIPAYAAAPIGLQVPIGAYIGVPLMRDDGSLFGTLCAVDPVPQRTSITAELSLVQLLARLLCNVLEADLKAAEQARSTERDEAEALSDARMGLYNQQGWELLLAAEEIRCCRFGHPAGVMTIELDDAPMTIGFSDGQDPNHSPSDELICRAAQAVKRTIRDQDILARIGEKTLALLAVECNANKTAMMQAQIRAALAEAEIGSTWGVAVRNPRSDLIQTWRDSEKNLSASKASRPTSRCS